MRANRKKWIFGMGFDDAKGHQRVTKGDNFFLFGGSQETHELMQEKALKLNEQLKRRGKSLDSISLKELKELACDVGLHPVRNHKERKR